MKAQPKSSLSQLKLPLLDPTLVALPPGQEQPLMQALIELLLSAVGAPTAVEGEGHESPTDR
jgi:hypothetical protein